MSGSMSMRVEALEGRVLLAAGAAAAGFGTNGIVSTDVVCSYDDIPVQVAAESDGDILVLGSTGPAPNRSMVLERYRPDGTLDGSFGVGGRVGGIIGSAMAIQGDGKIVVAGVDPKLTMDGPSVSITRLNADGSFDTSFGTAGLVREHLFSWTNSPLDIAIQADGGIIVPLTSYQSVTLRRYLPNGQRDGSFDGSVVFSALVPVPCIAIQSDGILALGQGWDNGMLTKLSLGGVKDNTFATAGNAYTSFKPYDMRLDGGNVVVAEIKPAASTSTASLVVERFTAAGQIDPSFGSGGVLFTTLPVNAYRGASFLSDGSVLVYGHVSDSDTRMLLTRINAAGQIDSTFGQGGTIVTDVTIAGTGVVGEGADGRLVIAGCAWSAMNGNDMVVEKLLPAGTPDPAFAGGKATTNLSGGGARETMLSSAAIPGGDTFVLARIEGSAQVLGLPGGFTGTSSLVLLRYLANGKLNTKFAQGGMLAGLVGVSHVAADDLGRAYLTGWSQDSVIVYRYLANGKLDRTFGKAGRISLRLPVDPSNHSAVAAASVQVAGDGSIYIEARRENNIAVVAAVDNRGRLIRNFGSKGMMRLPKMYIQSWSRTLVQDDGKVLAFQQGDGGARVCRMLINGRLDRSFGIRGRATLPSIPADVALLSDGRFITADQALEHPTSAPGDSCTDSSPNYVLFLRRYDSRGRLDKRFGVKGRAIYRPSNASPQSSSLAVQTDGKIIASMWATAPAPDYVPAPPCDQSLTIVRFTANGRLDRTFGASGRVTPAITKHDNSGSGLDDFIRRNGDVMVAGNSDSDLVLVRLKTK